MYTIIYTGRILPGRDEAESLASAAAFFGMDLDQLKSRIVSRAPVIVRETPDPAEIQAMRLHLLGCGVEAETVLSDGIKWQIEIAGAQCGPVPIAYLEAEFRSGRLPGSQRVKRTTDQSWIPLANAVSGDTATRVAMQLPPELYTSKNNTSPPSSLPPDPFPPPAQDQGQPSSEKVSDARLMLTIEAQKKSGFIAALLNFIIPGVGYMYCRRWIIGIFAFFLSALLISTYKGYSTIWFCLSFLCIIDGFLCANRYNKNLIKRVLENQT